LQKLAATCDRKAKAREARKLEARQGSGDLEASKLSQVEQTQETETFAVFANDVERIGSNAH
jgi:hypothetical protein